MTNFTDEQADFISAVAKGESVAANAVAGSGKTTALVGALATAPQSHGLMLVFNKANAEILKDRITRGTYQAMTMNGLGHRIWGAKIQKRLTVNARKTQDILQSWLDEHKERMDPDSFINICKAISMAKSRAITPGILNTPQPNFDLWRNCCDEQGIEPEFFDDHQALLHDLLKTSYTYAWRGLIDFDDQLYMPVVADAPFPTYPFVGVDEAQDLSPLQHAMISRIKAEQRVIVGDPHQAIYAFRGALSSSFEELRSLFSLREMLFSYSFRCPHRVASIAQLFVPHFKSWPSNSQGEIHRLSAEAIPFRGTVISRYNAPLLTHAFRCLKKGVAIDYLGRDFLAGLKSLNKKYPTPADLEVWLKEKMDKSKTEGAKTRAKDQYSSMLVLHENARGEGRSVEEVLVRLFSGVKGGQAVTLSTIHKAKGLEWSFVTLIGGADYEAYIDDEGQEANAMYVGLTRTDNVLNLTEPQRR